MTNLIRKCYLFSRTIYSAEFFTDYISFLKNIIEEKLELRESTTLHADPHDSKIGESNDRKIEKYVTHVPLSQNSSNILEPKAEYYLLR